MNVQAVEPITATCTQIVITPKDCSIALVKMVTVGTAAASAMMSMNVMTIHTTAILKQTALTPMGISSASVKLVLWEME